MFNEDLGLFFSDFAVPASFGAEQAKVIFDAPDQIMAGDDMITAEYQISYPVGTFAGLKYRDLITVNSTQYRVNTVTATDDGRIMVARLSKQ